jgi:signal transduction histidine kinase
VVDDEVDTAHGLADLLTEIAGYATSVCTSGSDALAQLARGRRPDAVLLDIDLRDTSGIDVLRSIRSQASPLVLPVIMVTAHDSGRTIAAALQAGANDYVTKPVEIGVLLARIATHLHLAELASLKDDLLQMASHDLKNPLTAVILCAQYLEGIPFGRPVDPEIRETAVAISRRARYMERLVNDFLDMQAARDGRLRLTLAPLPLAPLLAEVAAEQRDYAGARAVTVVAEGEPVSALADGARLAQALHNLVGNAVKFTPSGGRVELECRQDGAHAVVEVRDDGPGLGDDPEGLFVTGARGPASAAGGELSTGLGLGIARVLVERHGGTIRAENRPDGHGARFILTLPRAPG